MLTLLANINIVNDEKGCTNFTIFRYIDNPLCTSCQFKLGVWKAYNKRLRRKFGDNVKIRFLCETKRIDEAKNLFKMYGFKDFTVDSTLNFYEKNGLNPILGRDVVLRLSLN